MAAMGAGEVRVTVVGMGPDADEWASILGARGCLVARVASAAADEGAEADLVLALAPSEEAARIAAVQSARPSPPPLALLTGPAPHPLTRVVRAVVQAKREWESTFDAVVDPIALLDAEGIVRRANLALARHLGCPIQEACGRSFQDLLGPGEGDDPVTASMRDGLSRMGELRYSRLPGLWQVTVSALPEAAPRGLIAILKDVSQLREQQDRLLQAARLADVGQLAAGVAHEVNTPLAGIALRAERLLRMARDETLLAQPAFRDFPRYLQAIDDEIFRCKKIIAGLLEFSRARPPEVRETDLNALCESACELLGHQMRLKQVRLELRVAADLPPLRADEGQIRQAVVALLVNALDACRPGGSVRLTTAHEGGFMRVAVTDDGIGIPREDLGKIFTPFFSTKPVGQGTGLGLAICHGVVSAHGGTIEVESEPGRGTQVSLLLPAGGTA